MQFSYTSDAWAALTRKPTDRSKALGALAAKLGAKLVSLSHTMGDWDDLAIIEARDDKTAMAVIMAALGPGHVRATKTTRLYSVKETVAAMKKAGAVSYAAPRG